MNLWRKNVVRALAIFLSLTFALTTPAIARTKSSAQMFKGPATSAYKLQVFPWPLQPGESANVHLQTPWKLKKAHAVLGWFKGKYRTNLVYSRGKWRGTITIPKKAIPGWHMVYIYMEGTPPETKKNLFGRWLSQHFPKSEKAVGKAWIAVAPTGIPTIQLASKQVPLEMGYVTPPPRVAESAPLEPLAIQKQPSSYPGSLTQTKVDGITAASLSSLLPNQKTDPKSFPELSGITGISAGDLPELKITGTKVINFTSKTLEGSRESFIPATTREESLRLNIAGKLIEDVEVDANLLNTSTLGAAVTGDRQDKVNVHLKRRELEGALGDIALDLSAVEFAALRKQFSGMRVSGNYPQFGFTVFSANPQGQTRLFKSYGDGTTGPYRLGYSPVVVDSERVYVDKVLYRRGEDYTIDYNAGTVSFRKAPLTNIQIVEATFDHRNTAHPHQTLGGRISGKPAENVSLGLTYLGDSDVPSTGALTTGSATLPPAVAHTVTGIDGSLLLGDVGVVSAEIAQSNRNPDILNGGATDIGRAGKLELSTQYGPVSLRGHLRRVSDLFMPVADPNPKQGLTEHAATLGYTIFEPLKLEGGYSSQKYRLSGSPYATDTRTGRLKWSPVNWPNLTASVSDVTESTDPVLGQAIDRFTNKRDVTSSVRIPFAELSVGGGEEFQYDSLPVLERTAFRTGRTGITLLGIDPFTVSGNVELKETEKPDGSKPITRTYTSNISVSPLREYLLAGTIHQVDDTLQGPSGASELSYRAEPTPWFRTDGKWAVTSINERISTTREADPVLKQVGSINLELRPTLFGTRIKYFYRPELKRAETLSATLMDSTVHQLDFQMAPFSAIAIGFTRKLAQNQSIDPSDYPRLQRTQLSGATTSNIYSLKLAPLQFMSVELTHTQDDGVEDRLRPETIILSAPGYTRNDSDLVRSEAAVRTSITEKFSLDSRYTHEKSIKTSGIPGVSTAQSGDSAVVTIQENLRKQTGSFKVLWNLNSNWTLQTGSAFTGSTDYRITDNRVVDNQNSFVVTPTLGGSFRDGTRFRVDLDYSYSKSTFGTPQENSTYGLRAKYDFLDAVSFNLRTEHQVGTIPQFFRTNDFAGSVEIKL